MTDTSKQEQAHEEKIGLGLNQLDQLEDGDILVKKAHILQNHPFLSLYFIKARQDKNLAADDADNEIHPSGWVFGCRAPIENLGVEAFKYLESLGIWLAPMEAQAGWHSYDIVIEPKEGQPQKTYLLPLELTPLAYTNMWTDVIMDEGKASKSSSRLVCWCEGLGIYVVYNSRNFTQSSSFYYSCQFMFKTTKKSKVEVVKDYLTPALGLDSQPMLDWLSLGNKGLLWPKVKLGARKTALFVPNEYWWQKSYKDPFAPFGEFVASRTINIVHIRPTAGALPPMEELAPKMVGALLIAMFSISSAVMDKLKGVKAKNILRQVECPLFATKAFGKNAPELALNVLAKMSPSGLVMQLKRLAEVALSDFPLESLAHMTENDFFNLLLEDLSSSEDKAMERVAEEVEAEVEEESDNAAGAEVGEQVATEGSKVKPSGGLNDDIPF